MGSTADRVADRVPPVLPEAYPHQTFEQTWQALGSPAQRSLSCDGDEVYRVKSEESWPCIKCREITTGWFSISFMAAICCPECLNGLWLEYSESLRDGE